MIVIELVKKFTNAGLPANVFYWRDKTGHEIDVIIDIADDLTPIEIKSGKTINSDYFKNLKYWNNLSKGTKSIVIYSGNQSQNRSDGTKIINWRSIHELNF